MEQQHGASNKAELFLEDVAEQIQYKPVRDEIKEELAAHMEDRKAEYVSQGMDDLKAWDKAAEEMGDAVEIGVRLNEARKLQKNQPAVHLVMALLAIGLLGNLRLMMVTDSGFWFSGIFYFLFGFIVFTIVYYFGYQKLVKHSKKFLAAIIGIWGLYLVFLILRMQMISDIPFWLTSISVLFAAELLCIPAAVVIIYFNRNKKYIPFLAITGLLASIIGISTRLVNDYILTANLILTLSVYVALLYMIVRGMLKGKIRNQLFAWMLSLGVVTAIFAVSFRGDWTYMMEQCFYPEKVAQDYWDDAYNSVLIKSLLNKAEITGTVNLTQEELMGYYTDDWYFDNIDAFHYKYKMQFVDAGSVKLENIMPQHYQNDYRIAYWILKYGWLPAFVLMGIILTAYGVLIRMVVMIKNKMGKVIAFSCMIALILQMIVYTMGNLGYQFGWFCNFPFISEGISSITTNMILAGLACSAYRYDRVVKEESKNARKALQ